MPNENISGPVNFSYTISDGRKTSTGTVTFNVAAVNDAPIANPDGAGTANDPQGVFRTIQDQAVTIDFAALIANDRDVDTGVGMSGFYAWHNASIGLQCFAGGILFGVGGILITISNAAESQISPTAAMIGSTMVATWQDSRGADRDIAFAGMRPDLWT